MPKRDDPLALQPGPDGGKLTKVHQFARPVCVSDHKVNLSGGPDTRFVRSFCTGTIRAAHSVDQRRPPRGAYAGKATAEPGVRPGGRSRLGRGAAVTSGHHLRTTDISAVPPAMSEAWSRHSHVLSI